MLKDNIIFGENGRSIATIISEDPEEIEQKKKLKWETHKKNPYSAETWLRSPDEWIVDLFDFYKINYYGNPILNFAYFLFITDKIKNNNLQEFLQYVISQRKLFYKNFQFEISKGIVLETEVRLLATDHRVKDFKRDIIKAFLKDYSYSEYIEKSYDYLSNIRELPCSYQYPDMMKPKSRKIYDAIYNEIAKVKEKFKFNPQIIPGLIPQLPEYDVLLFIPKGCTKYMFSFIDETNADKVMLWEVHANKNVSGDIILFEKNLKNKKVLIIDTIYSGKTFSIISKLINEKGGIPITLGLFPKCYHAMKQLDYVLLIDKIIKCEDISHEKNWHLNCLRNILKNS